jgi:hypothetical protein
MRLDKRKDPGLLQGHDCIVLGGQGESKTALNLTNNVTGYFGRSGDKELRVPAQETGVLRRIAWKA